MTTLVAIALVAVGPLFDGEILYENRLMYLRANVNGKAEGLFLIDTGANRSALDKSFAEKIGTDPGEMTTVEGTGGTVNVPIATLKSLTVGKAKAANFKVTLQDFGGFLRPSAQSVDGILGSDFLKNYAVRIQFAERRLQVFAESAKQPGVGLPMRMDNGIPRIAATLNGKTKLHLRIDTGASLFETKDVYLNLPMREFEALKVEPTRYFTGTGTGGEVKLPVAQTGSLQIGDILVPKPFVIGQPAQGYFARPDAVGFVGNNLLEKFSPVVLDYRVGRLTLTPTR